MYVILKGPDGRRLAVNTYQAFALQEGADGRGAVISIGGFAVPTGQTFDELLSDMDAAEAAEVPEFPPAA